MASDNLLVERGGAVAVVTFNRPEVRNALNGETLDALRRVMLELKADEQVRFAGMMFGGFMLAAIVLGWLRYPFPL